MNQQDANQWQSSTNVLSKGMSLLLAGIMLCGCFSFQCTTVFATETNAQLTGVTAEALPSQREYMAMLPAQTLGTDILHIEGESGQIISGVATTILSTNFSGGAALRTEDDSTVAWQVTVPTGGLYTVSLTVTTESARDSFAQRSLSVDGKVPFSECQTITFRRSYQDKLQDGGFRTDSNGNQLRPETEARQDIHTAQLRNDAGELFQFYLTAGQHTLQLEATKELLVIDSITLQPKAETASYKQVEAGYTTQMADAAPLQIEAEFPSRKSDTSIYPTYDRISAITSPQSSSAIVLNTIGGNNWNHAGQWIEWNITIEKTGLYQLAFRYRQDDLQGVFSTRRLTIDGELPFAEMSGLEFPYGRDWQIYVPQDEDGKPYQFELTEGSHTVRLEVVLGKTSEVIDNVTAALANLNKIYREILSITGPNPDVHRDYEFDTVMPVTLKRLAEQSDSLKQAALTLEQITGEQGEMYAQLRTVYYQIDKMTKDPDDIARQFETFKSNLGMLGDWIYAMNNQPLELDYIWIGPDGAKLPAANESFWNKLAYNVELFIRSFVDDYSVVSSVSDDNTPLRVWVSSGRDQAQVINSAVSNTFNGNFPVEINLVSAATLLPATLSGNGPDVALGIGGTAVIDYALRNALVDLTQFEDLEDILPRFQDSAVTPLRYQSAVYGLPETQSFPMMFIRTDVFAEQGMKVPKTWDELRNLLPKLQHAGMNVGMLQGYDGLLMMLYQKGGSLYAADGIHTGLDTNQAMSAFKELCDLFTLYDIPISYNAANRFRSGEMPLLITDYTFYNTLAVFAPEIAGLWELQPVPGTERKNGTICNTVVTTTTAAIILQNSTQKKNAWEFLKWWTGREAQITYCNEMEAILGPSAKQATANVEALSSLSWTTAEYSSLRKQQQSSVGVETVPGYYQAQRLVGFAFNDVYNNNSDPVNQLEKNINSINQELMRKTEEFQNNSNRRKGNRG